MYIRLVSKLSSLLFCTFLFNSCNSDFLEKRPLDELTDDSYWNSSSDLKNFTNGFYQLFPRYLGDNVEGQGNDGADNTRRDHPSDILVVGQNNPSALLLQAQNSGQAPNTDNDWNSKYKWLREINYFIEKSKGISRDESVNQYIGEGYFFRAWVYFELLKKYGGIPYITKVLDENDTENLYKPRTERNIVAKNIISDLDSAIVNLNWKGVGSAAEKGRINREAAIVMKARVALFEGTWERYHYNNVFGVPNNDGTDFLEIIEPTIEQLIDHQGDDLFRDEGLINEPYNQLFSQDDASIIPGVFLYRIYDASLIGGHSFYEKITRGPSFTDNLVNLYLDKNGVPQLISSLSIDNTSLYNLSYNLDPRFTQTIWTPDKGSMKKVAPSLGSNPIYIFNSRYPYISPSQSTYPQNGQGGYKWWKGAVLDPEEFRNGSTDDILIRYAEALLIYAEAKAILNTITQEDLDKTINIIRSRVNMQPMILNEINSWPISVYDENLGFDISESNIVNEIRRERSIELAGEGFRLDDLKRWSVLEKVINGYKPKGAHVKQFLDYFNSKDSLLLDGYSNSEVGSLHLDIGEYPSHQVHIARVAFDF